MNLFKKYITVLLVGVLLLTITGCQSETKPNEDTSANAQDNSNEDTSDATNTSSDTTDEQDSNDNSESSITIKDCVGRVVVLDKEAERIVDLTTMDGVRTLIQLGAQDRVVGFNESSHTVFNGKGKAKKNYIIVSQVAPELKDLPVVGNIKEPNIEMIISLNPDIILIDSMAKNSAEAIQNQTNIPVVCVGTFGSFEYDMLDMLGTIVGEKERAQELIDFTKTKLQNITDITNNIPQEEKKRLYYWTHPMKGHAPKTNANYEAFVLAGANNVAVEADVIPKGVYEITKEQIIAWDPEYIFIHSPFKDDFDGWMSADLAKEDEVIQGTQAVIQDKVYPIKGELGGWDMSTQAAEVFYLAKILYPDKFEDLNVEKEGNEILKKYYNLDGLFTDMSHQIQLYEWE